MTYEGAGNPGYIGPDPAEIPTDSTQHGKTIHDILATTLAENKALKSELSELQTEVDTLKKLAYTDELTGLQNRHALARSFDVFAAANQPFGLLFIDIKNFKRVNELHTHAGGDEALRITSHHLAHSIYEHTGASFREDDVVASRRGGDEFAVLIKYAPKSPEGKEMTLEESLAAISERYQSSFLDIEAVKAYNSNAPKDKQIGLRIGYAVHRDDLDLNELIAAADPKGRPSNYFIPDLLNAIPLAEAGINLARHGARMARAGGSVVRSVLARSETEKE